MGSAGASLAGCRSGRGLSVAGSPVGGRSSFRRRASAVRPRDSRALTRARRSTRLRSDVRHREVAHMVQDDRSPLVRRQLLQSPGQRDPGHVRLRRLGGRQSAVRGLLARARPSPPTDRQPVGLPSVPTLRGTDPRRVGGACPRPERTTPAPRPEPRQSRRTWRRCGGRGGGRTAWRTRRTHSEPFQARSES